MRFLLFIVLAVAIDVLASGLNLRNIDFKNFEYPWPGPSGWPDHLEWLDRSESNRVKLNDGKWRSPSDSSNEKDQTQAPFSGLTLESVQFGDLIGNGHEEAIVVLRFDTGGTQYSHYVFIYSLVDGRPNLMGYFHSGDRSASGLYRLYPKAGTLVVELYDPQKSLGDCCSSGFVRRRYRWRNGTFVRFGPDEFGIVKTTSRIPVTVFGNH